MICATRESRLVFGPILVARCANGRGRAQDGHQRLVATRKGFELQYRDPVTRAEIRRAIATMEELEAWRQHAEKRDLSISSAAEWRRMLDVLRGSSAPCRVPSYFGPKPLAYKGAGRIE